MNEFENQNRMAGQLGLQSGLTSGLGIFGGSQQYRQQIEAASQQNVLPNLGAVSEPKESRYDRIVREAKERAKNQLGKRYQELS